MATHPLLRLPVLVSLMLAACGDDGASTTPDAAPDTGDSDATDAAPDTGSDTDAPDGDAAQPDSDAGDPDTTDASDGSGGPGIVEQLAARGPERVGFRLDEVTYTPRDRDEERTLRLALWYPADEGGRQGTTYNGLVNAPDVWVNAPLAAGDNLPLLVYSHGHLGFAEVSSFVAEHLASHGWIVAAPDHTGNTTGSFGQPRRTEIYYLRSWDISAVIDWLRSDASGGINTQLGDDVVAAGHSFGGYTAFSLGGAAYDIETLAPRCYDMSDTSEFCSEMTEDREAIFATGLRDPRIVAVIAMDAGDYRLFGPEGFRDLPVPALMLDAEAGGADGDEYWEALAGEQSVGVRLVDGAPHNAFTTICAQELGVAFDCDPTSPLPAIWQRAVLVYVSAFVADVLDNDARVAGVLDGTEAVPSAVVLGR